MCVWGGGRDNGCLWPNGKSILQPLTVRVAPGSDRWKGAVRLWKNISELLMFFPSHWYSIGSKHIPRFAFPLLATLPSLKNTESFGFRAQNDIGFGGWDQYGCPKRSWNVDYFGQRIWGDKIIYWLITSALEPEKFQALLLTQCVTYDFVLLSQTRG